METRTIDALLYKKMIVAGAANLKNHVSEINDLNVFPIPDGDTGDNMLMTVLGGAETEEEQTLGQTSRRIADGMLLSARGNSGVILSQFFDGIAEGLDGLDCADILRFSEAISEGVRHAYAAVTEPTEGTILTVAREAAEFAGEGNAETGEKYLDDFLSEAKSSLLRTPEKLEVLKKAGVVDSGGAGLVCIVEGMRKALDGETEYDLGGVVKTGAEKLDLSRFDENSVLEYGYCTELLLRLQNAKTDVNGFQVSVITDYLQSVGNSVVAFKTGSIVKIHVHTETPDKVLGFCRNFGEFLTVKIENMSLQHNNSDIYGKTEKPKEQKKYGVVTVACGNGIKQMMLDLGADEVIDGGQSMNPSAKDFLDAFGRVNADTIFVFPNNGNVVLAAKQAAKMYSGADIRVLESKTLGEGHAALTMLNTEIDDPDEIVSELQDAMKNVTTAAVSTCSRDTTSDDLALYKGEYIGFIGDRILSADNDRSDTAKRLVDGIDFADREICIIICGNDADAETTEEIRRYVCSKHPMCEVYVVDGGQEIYHYIFIVE